MYLDVIFVVSFLTTTLANPGLLDLGFVEDILSPLVGPNNHDRLTTKAPKEFSNPNSNPYGSCIPPKTKLATNTFKFCKGDLIFSDDFEKPFNNQQSWDIEQYMPIEEGPDFEFVTYENDDEIVYKMDGKLIFNPMPRNESEVFGELDLRNGCTSKLPSECYFKRISTQLIPPVRSAKITNKFGFTYGAIDIKAKLPHGDWIYPQIQLVSNYKYAPFKIAIAYSRGNTHYINNNAVDEGSSLLFGGILYNTDNLNHRLRFTKSRPNLEPYGNKTHTYTLFWEPHLISLYFNDKEYGHIDIDENDERFYPLRRTFHLTLGVGVGGINDFPDGYTSSSKKPWMNADRNQMKNFFDARTAWAETWRDGKSIMEIESVKIYAV